MIYKVNFLITLVKEKDWLQITKKITSLAENYVLTGEKDSVNFITSILDKQKIKFTIQEINPDDIQKKPATSK